MDNQLNQWLARYFLKFFPGQVIDIHIDELDASLKSPEQWISGIQRMLAEGVRLLASYRDGECTLAGCIALRSSTEAIGVNFSDEVSLCHELDVTPPSLYLFPFGNEPWSHQSHDFVQLVPPLRLSILSQATIKYLEYQEPTEAEFRRSLWLVPPADAMGRMVF